MRYLILLSVVLIFGCDGDPQKPFIIQNKFLKHDNEKISIYWYNGRNEFEDSTGKYNVGDTLK